MIGVELNSVDKYGHADILLATRNKPRDPKQEIGGTPGLASSLDEIQMSPRMFGEQPVSKNESRTLHNGEEPLAFVNNRPHDWIELSDEPHAVQNGG